MTVPLTRGVDCSNPLVLQRFEPHPLNQVGAKVLTLSSSGVGRQGDLAECQKANLFLEPPDFVVDLPLNPQQFLLIGGLSQQHRGHNPCQRISRVFCNCTYRCTTAAKIITKELFWHRIFGESLLAVKELLSVVQDARKGGVEVKGGSHHDQTAMSTETAKPSEPSWLALRPPLNSTPLFQHPE